MSEKEGGGEFFGQHAAVYGHERHAPPFARPVDVPGDGLLTRPVRTENQDRHVRRRDQRGEPFHMAGLYAAASEQHLLLPLHGRKRAQYLVGHFQQPLFIYGLGQVVFRARTDGTYRIGHRCVLRHDDIRGRHPLLARPFQEGDAVPFGQPHVREDQIESRPAEQTPCRRLVDDRRYLVPGLQQPVFLHLRQADVIFNDQYLPFHASFRFQLPRSAGRYGL